MCTLTAHHPGPVTASHAECEAVPGDELSRVSTSAEKARPGGSRCKQARTGHAHAHDAGSPQRDAGTGGGIAQEAPAIAEQAVPSSLRRRAAGMAAREMKPPRGASRSRVLGFFSLARDDHSDRSRSEPTPLERR